MGETEDKATTPAKEDLAAPGENAAAVDKAPAAAAKPSVAENSAPSSETKVPEKISTEGKSPETKPSAARPAGQAPQGRPAGQGRPGGRPGGGRPGQRDGRPRGRPGGGGGRRHFRRRKVDYFSVNKIDDINYKNADTLRQFIGDRGKILPRRHTGLSAQHQRLVKRAIKRARNIALLPFAGER